MTARIDRVFPSRFVSVAVLATALFAGSVIDAGAARFTNQLKSRVVPPRLAAPPRAAALASEPRADSHQIVGMWAAEFRLSGGQLWDQAFELYHADGTEVAVDNAVPPLLGNVCVGVWRSAGLRTVKLRHMTWNWNLDNSPAGSFLLLVTATVSADGQAYEGTFISDSYDLDGHVIPELHAEGTVRGTRINVD